MAEGLFSDIDAFRKVREDPRGRIAALKARLTAGAIDRSPSSRLYRRWREARRRPWNVSQHAWLKGGARVPGSAGAAEGQHLGRDAVDDRDLPVAVLAPGARPIYRG